MKLIITYDSLNITNTEKVSYKRKSEKVTNILHTYDLLTVQ
jgi:hypothetical protein